MPPTLILLFSLQSTKYNVKNFHVFCSSRLFHLYGWHSAQNCIILVAIYKNRKIFRTSDWSPVTSATYIYRMSRGNVPDFGGMFLTLKYTDIAQNTYIRSWTVTEIMAREVLKYDSCYTLIDYQILIKTARNM